MTVRVTDLERVYGTGTAAVHALRGVTLQIEPGEVVALTGPSGSGKTTLLNCLLGLDEPTAGTVELFDTPIHDLSYEAGVEWRREHAAIVFQTAGLLPHLSAYENVELVLRMRNVNRKQRRARVDEIFDRLRLAPFAHHRPTEHSGGQRQRFALARAMVTEPVLLVADEPTGELDATTTDQVLQELRKWATEHHTTMLLATHDTHVEAIADRTLRLADGRLKS
jgi:putative ABC transport system ATP-binding protein